ncbi:MAG: prolipoprotein diacylglyceryl transferase [Actinobacteria bacterium]|nr:prolipoprotein diacylglyceryl transferase [Actinomycetota bacterium]MBU1493569.1 prolipoprotein diacylglyceryl transferase [Actinomycetota bacterium]
MLTTVLASIPSPSFNTFEIGPLTIHVYGILMGLGVATAYILTVTRYERFGGDRRIAERAAFWAVVIGFLGARLAYVSTHTEKFSEDGWLFPIKIWEGGIALFGGITFGILAVLWVIRRAGGSFPMFLDAVAVGLPAAQAIGRWGNYFNQELFGTPTNLPWGLEIAPRFRPAAYPDAATFHPTFLYESLWNVGVVLFLLWVERRLKMRRGRLFTIYMMAYGIMRFLLELMRTDTTFRFLGLSRNGWVALGVTIAGGILCWWLRGEPTADDEQDEAETEETADTGFGEE